nr:DUF4279 domain-containing protein [Paenibacillus bovis]
MGRKTSIEVYFALVNIYPESDFSLSTVTEKIGISPTTTQKKGEWFKPSDPNHGPFRPRQHPFTQWNYSTGIIETCDFEMVTMKIVDLFKDKVDIINELKRDLRLEPKFRAVTYIEEGISPGYSIPFEVMQFAMSIGAEFDIDQYISEFVTEDIVDVIDME